MMKHWDNFRSKWGFGDGDHYPVGIHIYLQWYIYVVNHFAEKMGSRYRAYHWDAGGIHNAIRIEWQLAEHDGEHEDTERRDDEYTEPAMLAAIDCARLFNPDQYIEVRVEVSPERDVTWDFWVRDYDLTTDLETFMTLPSKGATPSS